jgi:hypothetical protein
VIEKFTDKYSGKVDIPLKYSQNYTTSQSFVNFQELEKDLGELKRKNIRF